MIDENAFGFLISYFAIEDDEYGLAPEEFALRVGEFRELVLGLVREEPPGSDVRAFDFGHALYLELAEGDERGDPIGWLREARTRLVGSELECACVLTHGGRWVEEDPETTAPEAIGAEVTLLRVSRPSEPLRRALQAEAATHDDDEIPGWGPGLYVDSEAIEALGRSFKNAPTPLTIAGAVFFRAGR